MYGLIGEKLGHSFSADFFNKKFKREGIEESYRLFPIPRIEELPKLISSFQDLKGLNVTIPYKQAVIPYLSYISPEAREIGAVNTIKIVRNGSNIILAGYNSDCIGFQNSLTPLLNKKIKRALVLGTGGASKAVVYVLNKLGITPTLVSRNPKNNELNYSQLDKDLIASNLLIVNTTPLGTFPDTESCPPIPYHLLSKDHLCYDLVYNPEVTKFMKECEKYGAKVKNGLEMLHLQALASWDFWNQ